jgi:hypothetical protein
MTDSSNIPEEKQTRREMCRNMVRYLAVGGIGLLWAGLYVRSAGNPTPGSCSQSLSCGGCASFNQCNLPQAVKIKKLDLETNDVSAVRNEPINDGERQ